MRDAGAGINSALDVSLGWSCDVCFPPKQSFRAGYVELLFCRGLKHVLRWLFTPAVGSHSQLSVSVRISDHIRGIFG